ncbi:cytochrome c biogenesis protein CcdA [Thermodesulfobacteriota bacterium]
MEKRFINNRQGIFLSILLTFFIFTPCQSFGAVAKVDVIHSRDRYPVGEEYPIFFRIKIPEPWYLHGPIRGDDGIVPTEISFGQTEFVKIDGIQFPSAKKKSFPYAKEKLHVYSDEIYVRTNLKVKNDAPAGLVEIKGTLRYQACSDDSCLPPERVEFFLSAQISPEGTPSRKINREIFLSNDNLKTGSISRAWNPGNSSLWVALVSFFVIGLGLNLTPCIYPLIPITVSYFGGRGDEMKGKAFIHGILYISGLSITNSLLGIIAGLSGSILGAALQSPFVLIGVTSVLVWFGLSFFGLWELKVPLGLTRLASKNFGGYFGTFFMGLTLGIVAAPCLGPFVLSLLVYVGQKGEPFLGFLYFFVLSLGMGLPLTVLAVFTSALEKLPMSGDWMVWVRKALGWVLLGMGGYMISPIIPWQMSKTAIISLIVFAAAIHLGWLERSRGNWRGFPVFKKAAGSLMICGAIIYFISPTFYDAGIRWIPYSSRIMKEAAEKKKPVMLDFYADWCVPCVAMDKGIFRDAEVVRLSKEIIPVRVDMTQELANQDEILEKFRVKGVPTIIFINRKGLEERELRVESYKGEEKIKERMRALIEGTP